MKPTPPGWPRISTALYYEDPPAAIAWLGRAFGFEPRIVVRGDDGSVHHSELVFGDGVVMVAAPQPGRSRQAPGQLGGANTQNMFVYVDDVDAHCRRAREAGATIVQEPQDTDYGEEYWADRGYEARDLGGHHWWFAQRLRTGNV